MQEVSGASTIFLDLTKIINTEHETLNPEKDCKEKYPFLNALSKMIEYATNFKKTIATCTQKYVDLAKCEKNKKLNSKDLKEAQKDQLLFGRKVTSFEELTKQYKNETISYQNKLNSAKQEPTITKEEQLKVNEYEDPLKKITELKDQLLAIVDDANPKNPLRNTYNWFCQIVMREGQEPGNLKWSVSFLVPVDKGKQLIPEDVLLPLETIIASGSDPNIRANAMEDAAKMLMELAKRTRDNNRLY